MQLGGLGKNRDSRPISGFSRVVNAATPDAPDRGKLVTSLVSGVFCCSGDGRRYVYDKKPQRYAEDNRTEFNCTQ